MPNPTAPIAEAIAEGFKYLRRILDTAEVRKMRKAIEAGEKYIQVNENSGPFDYEMSAEKKQQRLKYYKKRFFKYNQ